VVDPTTRNATRAAANPAKWKCATVSDRTVRLNPNSLYDERSATSQRRDRRSHQCRVERDLPGPQAFPAYQVSCSQYYERQRPGEVDRGQGDRECSPIEPERQHAGHGRNQPPTADRSTAWDVHQCEPERHDDEHAQAHDQVDEDEH
jgi:hypothetical protein